MGHKSGILIVDNVSSMFTNFCSLSVGYHWFYVLLVTKIYKMLIVYIECPMLLLLGGYNALQRMYRDIQEPMLNVASSMAGNPFSGLVDNSGIILLILIYLFFLHMELPFNVNLYFSQ